jgi:hypothetical protein
MWTVATGSLGRWLAYTELSDDLALRPPDAL